MPCSAQTRRGLQWIVGAQLIYKILSAIKVPLADELVAVPCRLVLAVKQVLRIGRGRQKCHLAALLSFMLKLLLSCPEPTFGEILSPFEPGGEKRKEGVWRGQMLALKSMSNAFLFGTPVPPNGRQYIYSQRVLLYVQLQLPALSDKVSLKSTQLSATMAASGNDKKPNETMGNLFLPRNLYSRRINVGL